MKKQKKMGRPTDYTIELAEEICFKVATSSKSLEKLCKENSHWPNQNTVCEWRIKHKDFGESYARSKQCQIEVLIDEIIEIADDTSNDYVINKKGDVVPNHELVNRSRLKIDTRKWLAAKLCPRLYGDRPFYEDNSITKHADALKELEG